MQSAADDTIAKIIAYKPTWTDRVQAARKSGCKLVGYTGRFIPEELVYGAGAKPCLICKGGEPAPVEAVLPYMLQFLNPYVRAQIGYHVLGLDPVMPMLNLIVAQCDDCHMSRLADMFEYFKLPTARLGIPPDWKKTLSFEYYHNGLEKLKTRLEVLTGNTIENDRLRTAIAAMNRLRKAIWEIDRLRKTPAPPVGGSDFIKLNHASYQHDPEAFAKMLEVACSSLQRATPFKPPEAPRILLAGRVVAMGDYTVPEMIEASGGIIVDEFLDEGMRHFRHPVKTEGDLIDNIANTYYYERTPPSIFQPAWGERKQAILQKISARNIDGVVWYQLAFDEIYNMEYAVVAKALQEMAIPILKLETAYAYSREAIAPLSTRVESFIQGIRLRSGKRN